MTKNELLTELSYKLESGEISENDLQNFLQSVPQHHTVVKEKKSLSHYITKMLYVLGAVIVILGIVIFIAQIWDELSSFLRIIITLGLGLLTTALGSILLRKQPDQSIGLVFQFIGGFLIPGGALVALSESNINFDTPWPLANTFGIVFLFYVTLNFLRKNVVLTLFSIINGTIFVYLLTEALIDGQGVVYQDIYTYLTMLLGISYMLMARAFYKDWNKHLSTALNLFGIVGFLGAAFYNVLENEMWQLFYFVLIAGCLWLAVRLKSRIILIVSMLFLIIHISYITGEYFADSVGWPISLMVLGFLFIALGYISISINRKYISN